MDPTWGPAYGVHMERPDQCFMERLSRLLIARE